MLVFFLQNEFLKIWIRDILFGFLKFEICFFLQQMAKLETLLNFEYTLFTKMLIKININKVCTNIQK